LTSFHRTDSFIFGKEIVGEDRGIDRILRRLKLHAEAVSLATNILELGERIKSLTLIPSSGGAFEIRANGKLLHSKLDTGDWPDFDAIVTAIKKAK